MGDGSRVSSSHNMPQGKNLLNTNSLFLQSQQCIYDGPAVLHYVMFAFFFFCFEGEESRVWSSQQG